MDQTILNLLTLIETELLNPLISAFSQSSLINNFLTLINKFLNAMAKLFHADNQLSIESVDLATIFSVLVLWFALWLIIKSFTMIINFIMDAFTDIQKPERRFKTGGHKKRKKR